MNKKLIAEFIGTFFLFATIAFSVIPTGNAAIPPIAIGVMLAVMVYACGPLSGAHFNPAVTIALLVLGMAEKKEVGPYIAVQCLAAAVAALIVIAIKPDYSDWLATAPDMNFMAAITVEILFTFGLVWVILNVAVAKAAEGNSYFGLAIGGFVMAGALAVGAVSGAAFNPAVALGLAITELLPWGYFLAYCVATTAGGVLAAVTFKLLAIK